MSKGEYKWRCKCEALRGDISSDGEFIQAEPCKACDLPASQTQLFWWYEGDIILANEEPQ
jgi:hypothetical protein